MRDLSARQTGDEIEVTPQMIEAGSAVLWGEDLPPAKFEMPLLIDRIYRVMELVRRGFPHEAAVLSERPLVPPEQKHRLL